jgi:hypothetical protein
VSEEPHDVHERPDVLSLHLARLQVLAESAGDRPVAVRQAVADQPEPDREHEPAPEREIEDAGGLLRLVAALAARAGDEGKGKQAEPRVEEPLHERAAALGPAFEVAALVVAVEQRLREPPGGIGAEPEPERDEDDHAVPLLGEQPKHSGPVGRRAADPERDEDGQHADEPEGDALRHEADAPQPLDPIAVTQAPQRPRRRPHGAAFARPTPV